MNKPVNHIGLEYKSGEGWSVIKVTDNAREVLKTFKWQGDALEFGCQSEDETGLEFWFGTTRYTRPQSNIDFSKTVEAFPNNENGDDVSLESAIAANQMQPKTTKVVKVYDYELGEVDEYVTVDAPQTNKPQKEEDFGTDPDAPWMAESMDIFDITVNGKAYHSLKWNLFYDYTPSSDENRREAKAVRAELTREIERRKQAGQKPNVSDREV